MEWAWEFIMLNILGIVSIIAIVWADWYITRYDGDFSVDIFKFWMPKVW